jgi:hypothetical protein
MAVSLWMQSWLRSPSPPVAEERRFASQCRESGCVMWTFGDTQHEADDRMTVHRGQRHGFAADDASAGD